ncbi:hypothetical protein VNO80_15037 [Phaseolus coccineus]|uniref:Uncharacterized protein n=1 Tax=Phaseolus coccineus TaxID=3886 RepID=A0AAN9QYY0_PHACN
MNGNRDEQIHCASSFPTLPFQNQKEINKKQKQNRQRKNCPKGQLSVKTVYAFTFRNINQHNEFLYNRQFATTSRYVRVVKETDLKSVGLRPRSVHNTTKSKPIIFYFLVAVGDEDDSGHTISIGISRFSFFLSL